VGGVAGGRYKAILRGGKWRVRAPDGRLVGDEWPATDEGRAAAEVYAARATAKLRANDLK
jgi:hypothetical protein